MSVNGHGVTTLDARPSALPRPDDPGQARTAPARPRRRDRAAAAFRRNWWRLVFAAVGAVAAVVSYGHIVSLFLSWHIPGSRLDAHLMPIAIDGLIIIGAGAARSGQAGLGWSAIGPGLAASLYANVMNGLPYGWQAALGSGWATVALFLATNVMERWKAAPPPSVVAGDDSESVPAGKDDKPPVVPPRGKSSRGKLTRERAKQLAAEQGVSERTIYRQHSEAKT